jgi:beta-lactamase superfamily II metal-dependent hydrolase
MKQYIKFLVPATLLIFFSYQAVAQNVGEILPEWTPGTLDIHEISTGRGSSTFFMMPDGTTMLYDVGEVTEITATWRIPRYVEAKPDSTRASGEWITRYIERLMKQTPARQIDYALLSHFHWDHMGQLTDNSPQSKYGPYKQAGITRVAEQIPIKTILDRGWPDYSYPIEQSNPTMLNYRAFLNSNIEHNKMKVERFESGSNEQIVLQYKPKDYPEFEVRNLAVNGKVWTGVGNVTRNHYPPLNVLEKENYPDENMCSIALRLSYGKFDYFTGGDIRGIPQIGSANWQDLETPIASAIGPVEVSILNHHGYIDSQNAFFVSSLRPQVWLMSVWDSAHPSPMVYKRLLSEKLYPGSRDIFATGMHEANKIVVVGLDKLASDQGHIVLRVAPGGNTFQVIVLDDNAENSKIKSIHGPYVCR